MLHHQYIYIFRQVHYSIGIIISQKKEEEHHKRNIIHVGLVNIGKYKAIFSHKRFIRGAEKKVF